MNPVMLDNTRTESLSEQTSAEDLREINHLHTIVHIVGNVNEVPALMKTKEQRQAELELVLQGV